MTWDEIKGNWRTLKGRVRERWGRLTDDDLDVIEGEREQLEGRIRARYAQTKEQVRKEVDEFCNSCSF